MPGAAAAAAAGRKRRHRRELSRRRSRAAAHRSEPPHTDMNRDLRSRPDGGGAFTTAGRDDDEDHEGDDDDDIEEQLRRQREKQRQRQLEEKEPPNLPSTGTEPECGSAGPPATPQTLGRFVYDAARGSYFPAAREGVGVGAKRAPAPAAGAAAMLHRTASNRDRLQRLLFAGATDLRSPTRARARAVSRVWGQAFLNSFRGWPDTTSPAGDRLRQWLFAHADSVEQDAYDRFLAPAWSKMLSVAPQNLRDQEGQHLGLPDIAYLHRRNDDPHVDVSNPFCIQQRNLILHSSGDQDDIATPPVWRHISHLTGAMQSIRCSVGPSRHLWPDPHQIGILWWNDNESKFLFSERVSPSYATMERIFCMPDAQANDFLVLEPGKVVFATNGRPGARRVYDPATLWAILSHDAVVSGRTTQLQVHGYPHSNAICVEPAEPVGVMPTEEHHTCLFGHLDGSISLYDVRCSTIGLRTDQDTDFGNVLSMHCFQRHQVLLRGGGAGSGRLVDLRQPRQVVRRFETPQRPAIDALATAKCSGITADPSGSVVFAPFVSEDLEPSLGAWSIQSGDLIGSRSLAPAPTPTPNEGASRRFAKVEMCGTLTPAYEAIPGGTDYTGELPRLVRRADAFGLWFLLSASGGSRHGDTSTGIHHVSFRGHSAQEPEGQR